MTHLDPQDARIEEIIGDDAESTFEDCLERFFAHLKRSLELPCLVVGSEDFRWEEYYVMGPGDPVDHQELRKNQPSYEDSFELLEIQNDVVSQWMMYRGDDIAARVRRTSDGKEFHLGLAEIEAVDKKSTNFELLHDYAVWFVNSR